LWETIRASIRSPELPQNIEKLDNSDGANTAVGSSNRRIVASLARLDDLDSLLCANRQIRDDGIEGNLPTKTSSDFGRLCPTSALGEDSTRAYGKCEVVEYR